jgi:hypothetical protein
MVATKVRDQAMRERVDKAVSRVRSSIDSLFWIVFKWRG